MRSSSVVPSSNSWLPTLLTSRPIALSDSTDGSSWKMPERKVDPPMRSPAATVRLFASPAAERSSVSLVDRFAAPPAEVLAGSTSAAQGWVVGLEVAVVVVERQQLDGREVRVALGGGGPGDGGSTCDERGEGGRRDTGAEDAPMRSGHVSLLGGVSRGNHRPWTRWDEGGGTPDFDWSSGRHLTVSSSAGPPAATCIPTTPPVPPRGRDARPPHGIRSEVRTPRTSPQIRQRGPSSTLRSPKSASVALTR